MVIREGSNVSMVCKAVGFPEPFVMWRREDGENINYNGLDGKIILHFSNFDYFFLSQAFCRLGLSFNCLKSSGH